MVSHDILQVIPDEDIPKLQDVYKKQLPCNTHFYKYLDSVIKWKKSTAGKNYITLLAPHGDWKNGTIVGIHKFDKCYEFLISTLEEDQTILFTILTSTQKIKWDASLMLYAIHTNHNSKVMEALRKTNFRYYQTVTCDVWWMSCQKALKFEINCPSDVYLNKLDRKHAMMINSHWTHRYKNSDKFIQTLIEMNGGYGVFLRSCGTLVAWILRNLIGMGILQTVNKYKRKGYGSFLTKVLAKEIAQEGLDPIGTVLQDNTNSQKMFEKLGFKILETIVFIESVGMKVNMHTKENS